MKNKTEQPIEYTDHIQRLFIRMMLTNPELYTRVQNIVNSQNFNEELQSTVDFMAKHAAEYVTLPTLDQIEAITNQRFELVSDMNEQHSEWFLKEFETFTRREELHRAIFKSVDLLEKHEFLPVEKMIKDAVQISLQRDLGLDFFSDPRGTLERIKSSNGQISTGWPTMDAKLYGGFNRGELQIFAGGSGSGKSLFMQNLSVNWITAGLNGVYISLELSEELCAWRIYSMLSDTVANRVFKEVEDVELKVKMAARHSGKFRIKYMPAQSTVNDIRAYVKNLQVETGVKIDFICVDYLDLLMPVSARVSPSDLFVKDKYVSEELRNLAKELNVLLVTASQLNRSAVEEVEFDHSHISGGISKINTADNVFGIFTSRHMREKGEYQLQLMKTRSSNGVGSKIELKFDIGTMRITDSGGDDDSGNYKTASTLLNQIKNKSTLSESPPPPPESKQESGKITANVTSNKLKNLLGNIKAGL